MTQSKAPAGSSILQLSPGPVLKHQLIPQHWFRASQTGGREGGRSSKGRGKTGRGPAGVSLPPAGCPVCPQTSLCSAAAGLRAEGPWLPAGPRAQFRLCHEGQRLRNIPVPRLRAIKTLGITPTRASAHRRRCGVPAASVPRRCPPAFLRSRCLTRGHGHPKASHLGLSGGCHPTWHCSHLQQHPCGCRGLERLFPERFQPA